MEKVVRAATKISLSERQAKTSEQIKFWQQCYEVAVFRMYLLLLFTLC